MKKFAIATLGCKVNQYESALIEESLTKGGYKQVEFKDSSDIYIVNTCTVTSRAGYQSRQLLRRALRKNPDAVIVAAGCYSEVEAQELASLGIATHILGNIEKLNIESYIKRPASIENPVIAVSKTKTSRVIKPGVLERFPGRTRAFLRIQDGCDSFCTYCIVPYTRGRSRSVERAQVMKQIESFVEHGFREIVLTGIHLGKWGLDLVPRESLSTLLEEVLGKFPGCRFRISSIEPPELTGDILILMSEYPNFCKHLHVPLQSASDRILEKMHRPYTSHFYEELCLKAHNLIPDLSWGLDVIVGFPGETEELFRKTYEFIYNLPIAYMHVFPFSPRSHTPAAHFPDQVPGEEKRRRAAVMRELSLQKRKRFMARFVGKTLEVLVEGTSKKDSAYLYGLTSNYLRVLFDNCRIQPNTLVEVRIEKLVEHGLLGKVVKRECSR